MTGAEGVTGGLWMTSWTREDVPSLPARSLVLAWSW